MEVNSDDLNAGTGTKTVADQLRPPKSSKPSKLPKSPKPPKPKERVIDAKVSENDLAEQAEEVSLRPLSFADYIGQERLKNNLKLAIDAVKKRDDGTTLDHVLLYEPPGLGKTTMANIIAHELGANLRVTSGLTIERAGDLASILTNLQNGDVLFIDEIHRLRRAVEEVLYSAMEDYKLDIVIGKVQPLAPFASIFRSSLLSARPLAPVLSLGRSATVSVLSIASNIIAFPKSKKSSVAPLVSSAPKLPPKPQNSLRLVLA